MAKLCKTMPLLHWFHGSTTENSAACSLPGLPPWPSYVDELSWHTLPWPHPLVLFHVAPCFSHKDLTGKVLSSLSSIDFNIYQIISVRILLELRVALKGTSLLSRFSELSTWISKIPGERLQLTRWITWWGRCMWHLLHSIFRATEKRTLCEACIWVWHAVYMHSGMWMECLRHQRATDIYIYIYIYIHI